MTTHTERTREWLDQGSTAAIADRLRSGFEPLYGSDDRVGRMPVGHVVAMARSYAILTALATVDFRSCLDVGTGNGLLPHLIGRLYGASCAGVDLGSEFAARARRDFGLPVYVANAAALPFADGQFDLVLCSEVIEHVEHPFAVFSELWRVARGAVVITTQEVSRRPWQRRLQMAAAERAAPHAERSYFLPEDFRRLFGDAVETYALLQMPERIRLYPRRSLADLADCVRSLAADRAIRPGSFGVLALARKSGAAVPRRVEPADVLSALLQADRELDALAARRAADPFEAATFASAAAAEVVLGAAPASPTAAQPAARTEPDLSPVCPECAGPLRAAPASVACETCGATFAAPDGVPRLLASERAVARSEARWTGRSELAALRRELQRPALPLAGLRRVLRTAIKLQDFVLLPLGWRDKIRLAWRVLAAR